jgi:2-C-methyl-D-erythritol 2,4-cyclodiphosphate synthase
MDALLGAAGLGDIGQLFPDSDPAFKDISSLIMLQEVVERVKGVGFRVENVDAVIIAQEPRLSPYREEMKRNIAGVLGVETGRVGVKATTTEGMGFTGRKEGMAALAVVLLNEE